MLNKNNRTVSRSSEPTIIGSGVKLTGTLQDEGPIIIHGSSQGTLISEETIFIGENAHIEGPVTAKTIKVSGKVEGELIAHEVLEITATGHITGKLKTKTLVIEPGAFFCGQCQMEEIKQAAIQEESKEKEVKKSVKEEFAVELED